MPRARLDVMAGWKSVEECVAYQLSVELRDEITRLTMEGPVTSDFKFRNQIRDSAASAVRNLSEGFDRYRHPEFAHLASIAKASLAETMSSLEDGHVRRYFSKRDAARLLKIAERAKKTTAGLIRHLRTTPTPEAWLRIAEEKERAALIPSSLATT